jgi:hypothetical protein
MALQTSPCKKHTGQRHVRGGRKTETRGRGCAARAAYDAEDRRIEVDVAEAAELAGLADDGAGPRETEVRGDRRHVHGRRRVGGAGIGAGIGEREREADLAFWRGQIVAIWAVSGPFWRAREMAGGWDCSLSRLTCLKYFFFP